MWLDFIDTEKSKLANAIRCLDDIQTDWNELSNDVILDDLQEVVEQLESVVQKIKKEITP